MAPSDLSGEIRKRLQHARGEAAGFQSAEGEGLTIRLDAIEEVIRFLATQLDEVIDQLNDEGEVDA